MTVVIMGGSPTLRRRLANVTRTVLVNGSAWASQTRSSNSSALTTRPLGGHQDFEHAELLVGEGEGPAGPLGDAPVGVQGEVAGDQDRGQGRA